MCFAVWELGSFLARSRLTWYDLSVGYKYLTNFSLAEMSIEIKERGPEVAIQCSFIMCGIAFAYWYVFILLCARMRPIDSSTG